uniref:Uncharacterized protein n=1 Tax=Arundo donax TaxID=35708 RepID=A0A0A9BB19_ARUDO
MYQLVCVYSDLSVSNYVAWILLKTGVPNTLGYISRMYQRIIFKKTKSNCDTCPIIFLYNLNPSTTINNVSQPNLDFASLPTAQPYFTQAANNCFSPSPHCHPSYSYSASLLLLLLLS